MRASSEEEQKNIQNTPKGTWVLLVAFSALLALGWLIMYFGVFLTHGPVS